MRKNKIKGNVYFYEDIKEKLSEDEILKYFKLYKNGDKSARDKLIEHNLKLIIHIIERNFKDVNNKYSLIDKNDLMSAGIFGLIKSVDTFDLEKGYSFSTYAVKCIKNEIIRFLKMYRNDKEKVSMSEVLYYIDNTEEIKYEDIIDSGEDITSYYDENETKLVIKESLNILNDLEKKVVELYYGFNNDSLNQSEISKLLNISQAHISRILKSSGKKLSNYLQKHGEGFVRRKSMVLKNFENMPQLEKAEYCINSIINTNITIKELAKQLELSESAIYTYIKMIKNHNMELYKKYNDYILNLKNPLFHLSKSYTSKQILSGIHKLPVEERDILLLRYPINSDKPQPLKLIAKKYNIKYGTMGLKMKSIINHLTVILENNFENKNNDLVNSYSNSTAETIEIDTNDDSNYNLLIDSNIKKLISSDEFEKLNSKITEYVFLMLKLGYLKGKKYTEKEIADSLGISELEVYKIINNGLLNLNEVSQNKLDTNDNSLEKILKITKEYR